jgi:hypothetical protein
MPRPRRPASATRRSDRDEQPGRWPERGFELRSEHPRFDPLDCPERRLDLRALPLGAEVRAQAGTQIPRAADVEHLVIAVAKEVDAGAGRRSVREVALVEHPPGARRRQRHELGDCAGAPFLREANEGEEHFGRRLRVRQSAVTRLHRRPEEVGELAKARARHAPGK